MTTSAGMPHGPRRDGLVHALEAVRPLVRAQADDVLSALPDAGDPATGRAVDDLVEQAGDALRALDELVTLTLRRLDAADGEREAARPPTETRRGERP